jgi:hypothetical protein
MGHDFEALSGKIIEAAISVHKELDRVSWNRSMKVH